MEPRTLADAVRKLDKLHGELFVTSTLLRRLMLALPAELSDSVLQGAAAAFEAGAGRLLASEVVSDTYLEGVDIQARRFGLRD